MPGDLVNVLNLQLRKSDTKMIVRQIKLLGQQRAILRELLLQEKTFKEMTRTDVFDSTIKHFEEEIAFIEERIRAYERILEAAQQRRDKD